MADDPIYYRPKDFGPQNPIYQAFYKDINPSTLPRSSSYTSYLSGGGTPGPDWEAMDDYAYGKYVQAEYAKEKQKWEQLSKFNTPGSDGMEQGLSNLANKSNVAGTRGPVVRAFDAGPSPSAPTYTGPSNILPTVSKPKSGLAPLLSNKLRNAGLGRNIEYGFHAMNTPAAARPYSSMPGRGIQGPVK